MKFQLYRVYLNGGGYDRRGAYWGVGDKLYYYSDDSGRIDGHVRAHDRAAAKEAVRKLHPGATFYR
jgi:hypothetical protein